MKCSSVVGCTFVLGAVFMAAGCVGDDPAGTGTTTTPGPDASTSAEGGGPGPGTNDGGGMDAAVDTGVDSGPPACTKIQVTTLAGGAAAGAANGAGNVATFNAPEGITVNPSNGDIYVGDTGNKLVRKVLADGTTSTFSTKAGDSGDWITIRRVAYATTLLVTDTNHDQVYAVTGSTTATSYCGWANMNGVAVQPTSFGIFLSNGTQIAECKSGNFTPVEISGSLTAGFNDGTGGAAKYDKVVDIAFDGTSILYAADQNNHRIRKVTISGTANNGDVVTLAGSATAGHVDGTGAAAQFEGPNALYLDPITHLLYVADGPTIRIVTPAGVVTTLVGSTAAFVDADGCSAKFVNIKGITKFANELYVTDVNRIRKIAMN